MCDIDARMDAGIRLSPPAYLVRLLLLRQLVERLDVVAVRVTQVVGRVLELGRDVLCKDRDEVGAVGSEWMGMGGCAECRYSGSHAHVAHYPIADY